MVLDSRVARSDSAGDGIGASFFPRLSATLLKRLVPTSRRRLNSVKEEYIPVVFPSDQAMDQAWDLMRKKGWPHLAYLGFSNNEGKDVLGLTNKHIKWLQEAKIPFTTVNKPT